ncbi:uncharacterized protein LOC144388309 [Gasterosteus aculeatus]
MGNLMNTACQMSNYSKRNVRVYVTEKALPLDAFIAPLAGGEQTVPAVHPGDKKFSFRAEVECVRVLASQTQQVPWEARRFVSVFVEDADDEAICSKQIMHNMEPSAPVTVLLYDL